jgi:hypothetical protein
MLMCFSDVILRALNSALFVMSNESTTRLAPNTSHDRLSPPMFGILSISDVTMMSWERGAGGRESVSGVDKAMGHFHGMNFFCDTEHRV